MFRLRKRTVMAADGEALALSQQAQDSLESDIWNIPRLLDTIVSSSNFIWLVVNISTPTTMLLTASKTKGFYSVKQLKSLTSYIYMYIYNALKERNRERSWMVRELKPFRQCSLFKNSFYIKSVWSQNVMDKTKGMDLSPLCILCTIL